MSLFLDDGDVRLYHGDALEQLRGLPDGCVDMVATSPPFYGLRDYGTEGQIGLEETPDQWVANLVAVFAECRRVLADHGVMFVEIGDSYNSGTAARRNATETAEHGRWENGELTERVDVAGCKPKDLLGQPWLLAFALRADGWYLRSEIIWARPNPMPESVTDRPTKSHSTVFLLSKKPRYFYDADAIREAYAEPDRVARRREVSGPGTHIYSDGDRVAGAAKAARMSPPLRQVETLDGSDGESPRGPDGRRVTAVKGQDNSEQHRDGERWPNPTGANARSVWTIPTEPTPFAHFATWPRKLVGRMILAGTSEHGKCPECGKPWVRQTEVTHGPDKSSEWHVTAMAGVMTGGVGKNFRDVSRSHIGWKPSCECGLDRFANRYPPTPVPCTVLDPFAGSGTTLLVARQHGRHAIGIELNAEYLRISADRLSQLSLLTEAQT